MQRETLIQSIQEKITQIEAIEKMIQAEKKNLSSLQQQQLIQKKSLQKEEVKRKGSLKKLKQVIQTTSQKLTRLKTDEKNLQALINRLETSNTSTASAPLSAYGLPTRGKITQSYGQALQGSLKSQGIFIAAPSGQAINAINEGRVLFSDWMRGYGLLMIIEHPGNILSLYAHCDSLLKETGDLVEKNESIALTGNSGGLPSSGVYFELRKNGKPINPVQKK